MEALGLANIRAEPVTVPRWERGEAEGSIVSPHPQTVALAALGGSVATPEGGITAEVVEAGSLEALEALPDGAVRGRIVFLNQRMERRRDGSSYGEVVGIRTRGASLASSKGAVATVIRSVSTGEHRHPHTGTTRYAEGVRPIPAAALSQPDADLLERQLAGGEPVSFHLRLTSRMLPEEQSANVVGEVVGRERPEEIVLLACHLDSWDLGPGAIDDAAGCGIVLEAARLIQELPRAPRRTVRVVLFGNEEFGLDGALAYAERHADQLDRHTLALEADFGAGRVWRFDSRFSPEALPVAERMHALLEPLGIEYGGNEARGGADLIPLRRPGVPLVDLVQDGTYYFDFHHSAADTLDKVDPDALAQNVAAYVAVAYYAAETPESFRPAPPFPAP
jgi:carboxypeptidase Q